MVSRPCLGQRDREVSASSPVATGVAFRYWREKARTLRTARTRATSLLISPFPGSQTLAKLYNSPPTLCGHLPARFQGTSTAPGIRLVTGLSGAVSAERLGATTTLLFAVQLGDETSPQPLLSASAFCQKPQEAAGVTRSPVQLINHFQPRSSERFLHTNERKMKTSCSHLKTREAVNTAARRSP